MSVFEKTKQALAVAEKHNFKSVISIDATKFLHMPASIHLADVNELTGYDCTTSEYTETSRQVSTVIDEVRVFAVLQIEENVA